MGMVSRHLSREFTRLVFAPGTFAAWLHRAFSWHKWHVQEIAHVRARIAADLHDDIGARLSQLAIASEVLSRGEAVSSAALVELAETSRQILQAMSEVVWWVDPTHDRLRDLVQRMRWFAGEALSAAGVDVDFSATDDLWDARLSGDGRRHVLLIFKEAVNNDVRHAGAASARVRVDIDGADLVLRIEDDGRGFDIGRPTHGNGLRNMSQRARLLKGELQWTSHPGRGCVLVLRVPLSGSQIPRKLPGTLHKHVAGCGNERA